MNTLFPLLIWFLCFPLEVDNLFLYPTWEFMEKHQKNRETPQSQNNHNKNSKLNFEIDSKTKLKENLSGQIS